MKKTRVGIAEVAFLLVAALLGWAMLASGPSWAANPAAPPSLKTVTRPEPNNLGLYLKSDPTNLNAAGFPIPTQAAREAAIRLGKALFWDMQLGSDGVQACATCHYHAGVDVRTKNAVSPGLKAGDSTFQVCGPNGTLTAAMFPFTRFANPDDRFTQMIYDVNDVAGSQGVHNTEFIDVPKPGVVVDLGILAPDTVFSVGGRNCRRVEPRNAPTVINAVFNFANFWDGRANNIFNGVNPFGESMGAEVFVTDAVAGMTMTTVQIPMASLASQAVGPPGSDFEMSFRGRTFSHIGKRLLALPPLAKQLVHPKDSVLGPLAKPGKGLKTTYAQMIMAAFQDKWWNNTTQVVKFEVIPEYYHAPDQNDPRGYYYENGVPSILPKPAQLPTDQFTQMEANFSLFFGLAIQLYEATLVSDDSPFDRFQEGDDFAMSQSAQAGLNTFLTNTEPGVVGASCLNCHGGPEFTNASVTHVGATNFGASLPEGLLERMVMGDAGGAFYDAGYYNIGIRPTEDDLGRGGTDPFGYPLSFSGRALLVDNGTVLPFAVPPLPNPGGGPAPVPNPLQRAAVNGAFKVPTLRNVELTGPYFHNGGAATLLQVVKHYVRGGSFNERNIADLDPDIEAIPALQGNALAQRQLVDFLMSLTDERVRYEKAPFDHPELFIPNGAPGNTKIVAGRNGQAFDGEIRRLPAVGAAGLPKNSPIKPFLGLDPHSP